MRVEARFFVTNAIDYAETTQVSLMAVKGEPFGKYTPNGNISMIIHNNSASELFKEALRDNKQLKVFFELAEENV